MYEKNLTNAEKNKNKKNLKKKFRSGDWPAWCCSLGGVWGVFSVSMLVANVTLICYAYNIFCTYMAKIC